MIGLPGAGKSTLARRLEAEHSALRLSPDEWMLPLFGAGESGRQALGAGIRAAVERGGAGARRLSVDVVLDYGLLGAF